MWLKEVNEYQIRHRNDAAEGDPVLAPPKESHDPEAEWTRSLPNTWAMQL